MDSYTFDPLVKCLNTGNETVLYHPLTHSTVFGDQSLCGFWSEYRERDFKESTCLSPRCFRLLTQEGLVVSNTNQGQITSKIKGYLRDWLDSSVSISQLYLILTTTCNFKCKYCRQVVYGSGNANYMSESVAFSWIDLLHNSQSENKKGIVFYGGEPMLSTDLLISCVRRVREFWNDDKTELTIITNGSSIDAENAKVFADNNVFIIVSIDGVENQNDAMRVDIGGSGTFERVCRGIEIYKKSGCKIGISCTLGIHNVQHIADAFSFFKSLGVVNIGVNLPHDGGDNPIWPKGNDDWLQHILDFLWSETENGFYVEHIIRKCRLYAHRKIKIAECPSIGGRVVVLPNEQIGVCEGAIGNEEFFFKNGNHKLDNEISKWKTSIPLLNTKCNECLALGICGGGCPLDGYFDGHGLTAFDSVRCKFYKKLISKILVCNVEFIKNKIRNAQEGVITDTDRMTFFNSLISNKSPKPLESSAIFGEIGMEVFR